MRKRQSCLFVRNFIQCLYVIYPRIIYVSTRKKFATVEIHTLYVIRCKSVSLTLKQAKRASMRYRKVTKRATLSSLKPRAYRRNIVGQQLPILLDVTCCVRLHALLHVVGSCCIRLHTTANTDATTPNIVGPTMLSCCVRVQNKAERLLSLPLLSKSKMATTRGKIRRNNHIAVSSRSLPASHSIIVMDNAAEKMYACSFFFRTNLFFKEQKEYSHVAFVSVLIVFLLLGAWTWVPAQQVSHFALR